MNILIDELPESLNIGGKEYKIQTDFSTIILMEELLTDSSISEKQKSICLIELLFEDEKPVFDDETAKQIEWFYRCGNVMDSKRKEMIAKRQKKGKSLSSQIYDFDYDAPLIFSAFFQVYHIDLNDTFLHWWKFKALFDSLPEGCKFSKVMNYRAIDVSKVKDKEERARIMLLKSIYAIPSNMTAEEKANKIGAML